MILAFPYRPETEMGVLHYRRVLCERYEYTPHGRRTTYSRGWILADLNDDGAVDSADAAIESGVHNTTNPPHRADLNGDGVINFSDFSLLAAATGQSIAAADPTVMHPRVGAGSFRGRISAGNPTPLCDVGHQGLMHDEEFDLVYNRARMLVPSQGRFGARDRIGYADGTTMYHRTRSNPMRFRDASGLCADNCERAKEDLGGNRGRRIYDAITCEKPLISCRDCGPNSDGCRDEGAAGCTRGNLFGPIGSSSVYLCKNHDQGAGGYGCTLIHELMHAYDICKKPNLPGPPVSPDDLACTEVRACKMGCDCDGKVGAQYEGCIAACAATNVARDSAGPVEDALELVEAAIRRGCANFNPNADPLPEWPE